MTVEEKVLKRVRPTDEEQQRMDDAIAELMDRIRALISERGLEAEPILVGSMAKGTNLKDPDIDLFVRFEPHVPQRTMEKEALALGDAVLENKEKRYAQHPYMKGTFKGFDTEIVPCYRVEKAGSKMSPVDRTPFHTRFIKDNLGPGLHDEVRLFKAFLKGIGIYGAEVAVEGFSGYLCEIVVLRFGGFRAALEAMAGWTRGVQLRLDEGAFPKFDDPMVFMDPVDPARNVAAPVSHHSFSLLVHAARAYIEAPSSTFFFPNPLEVMDEEAILRAIEERGTEVVGIEIPVPDVVEDIYASQLSKAERSVVRLLGDGGFPVVKGASYMVEAPGPGRKGRALMVMETGVRKLSVVHHHEGPEVGHPNERNFLEKWKDHPRRAGRPHIKDRRWTVPVRRESRRPVELIKARILELALGKHLRKEMGQGFRTLDAGGMASEFAEQMSEFLDDRFPWER